MYDCQGIESEEVHLQHSDILDIMSVVLRCPHVLPGLLVHRETDRNIVRQISASDDGGAGVNSDLPDAALKLQGVFQDFLHEIRTVLQLVLHLGNEPVAIRQIYLDVCLLLSSLEPFLHFYGLSFMLRIRNFHFFFISLETRLELVQLGIERIFLVLHLAQPVRHHLGKPVALFNAEMADSCHILDGTLRRHCTEGNHPGNVVRRVFPLHIFVRCGQILEIHVNIRHADTVRIQETLEQQLVLDRVQIGDFQAVSHYGTGSGTTSGTYHVAFGP